MESFPEVTPLWDLTQPPSFSSLPEDDFLALLQKQFPGPNGSDYSNSFSDGVNPQNITPFALPSSLSPPSDDSSPSPPNANDSNSRGQSEKSGGDHDEDHTMKRKASDDDFEEGPSSKNQHTSGAGNRKISSRRKSSGSGQDETRLLKRKEQNRAAQRAFRERKEKHVKDLEDKVAALQAQNDIAQSENENLRDLLSRLQNENVVLKNSSFTFAVPKNAGNTPTDQVASLSSPARDSPASIFGTASRPPMSTQSSTEPISRPSPRPPIPNNDIDWNSLTAFDPSVLRLLDESPQQTATDGAMSMDFGFGENSSSKMQYTTLASNPLFMSFADSFDTTPDNNNGGFNFDMQGLSPWPSGQSDINVTMDDGGSSLDSLFGGQYMDTQPPVDFNALLQSPQSTLSPVAHASVRSTPTSGSSPTSNYSLFNTPRDSASSFSEEGHDDGSCPKKSKEDTARHIAREGLSSFAPAEPSPILRKGNDGPFGNMIMCKGANFPKTAQSDQNIEVLSAWRSITSNPKFKDSDINELCTEFTSKARCDGTKVVLEPQGVHHILEKLGSKTQ